jgi:hypothetical protein
MFPSFCQTGPGDLAGSSWETIEGQQNFPELDHGDFYNVDSEDMMLPFGQATPKLDQDGSEDLSTKWTPELKALKSEPMRRLTSKSSAGSTKHRTLKASSKKTRPTRVQSALMTRTSSQYSNYEITGNASVYQEATIGNGRMMDPQQYLAQDLDTLSVSSHMAGAQAFNPGMMGLPADGLPYSAGMGFSMAQHVNPCATQIYDTGLSGSSPYSPLCSLSPDSRHSSPDDTFSTGPLVASPTTDAHDSPPFDGLSPRYVLAEDSVFCLALSHMIENIRMNRKLDGSELVMPEDLQGAALNGMCDEFSLPPAFGGRRLSGEGESARDHWLYKSAFPQADGLFHCPWEGTPSCNHKPEKLKCNYE